MSQKVLDMYNNATPYKSDKYTYMGNDLNSRAIQYSLNTFNEPDPKNLIVPKVGTTRASDDVSSKLLNDTSTGTPDSVNLDALGISGGTITGDQLRSVGNILQKYYGESDSYSIIFAAAEQEYGATPPSKKRVPSSKEPDKK